MASGFERRKRVRGWRRNLITLVIRDSLSRLLILFVLLLYAYIFGIKLSGFSFLDALAIVFPKG